MSEVKKARPTVILAEPEPDDALSSRKLTLETGKFNVITAHSKPEAIELFDRFGSVEAVVLHSELNGFDEIASYVRRQHSELPIVLLRPSDAAYSKHASQVISSHSPEQLLDLLRSMFGDPKKMDTQGV